MDSPVRPTFLRQVAQRFFFFLPSLSRESAASLSFSVTELLRLLLLVAVDNDGVAPTCDRLAVSKDSSRGRTRGLTSLLSSVGTGIADEATGIEVPVVTKEAELVEATVVMEVGLLRPGLLAAWPAVLVGDGGCCFFFTACDESDSVT